MNSLKSQICNAQRRLAVLQSSATQQFEIEFEPATKEAESLETRFRQISDQLLQYTCGRCAEILETRRKLYKVPAGFLSDSVHSIPPSTTHLFAEDQLSQTLQNCGGFYKLFPTRRDKHQTLKSQTPYYKAKHDKLPKSASRTRIQQRTQKQYLGPTKKGERRYPYKSDSKGSHQPAKKK
nr:unnamed protein product [Callosobruchus analis]